MTVPYVGMVGRRNGMTKLKPQSILITMDPHDVIHFELGTRIVIGTRPRWYLRLWRWLTRYKPPEHGFYTVTGVDRDTGTLTCK